MRVDGVGGDFIEPVAKVRFAGAIEPIKIFDGAEENSGGNIFSGLSFKEPMHAVAKHGVVISAVEQSEGVRVDFSLPY